MVVDDFAFWFALFAFAVALWSAWFGWYMRQSTDPGSRTFQRQYRRMMRRHEKRKMLQYRALRKLGKATVSRWEVDRVDS